LNIALFHFHVTQIKRSAGQSAVAAAAYRAGEKLHSEYYGEDSDYTRKGGVICSEILLPSHAPPEYADRETLWNAVEKAERGEKAQLAYSFDIALQNEFSMQENIDLARQFLSDNFVSRGMVADFAVHQPDKEDGGISNPHFHVMCPIRPIEPDGKWGNKQRREYVLDEHGERVLDEAGNYVFNAVPTTDWGKPETLETWRHAWAELCNAKFAEKGLDCWIDHRSYERQGIEQIPTVHEGPSVRAMEAKGIHTDKGDLNRWLRKTNALLREAKEKIAALIGWLKDVKAELAKPQPPMLNDLLALHCANRNKGAYSNKAKNANLQRYAEAFSFLQSKKLYTVDDLENTLHAMQDKIDTLKKSASSKQARIKEVDELLRMVDYYKSGKPAADKLKSIRFEKSRQQYKSEHEDSLRTFYMAERKLKLHFKDGKLPITAWRREREQLDQEYKDIQTELSPLYADAKKLWAIHYNIYEVQHEQERQNAATRQKKQEIER
jgi:chaperonin cofactor prefoldin